MKGYLALIRGSLTIGLVYRFGFIFTILGNIVYMNVAYFLWGSIYQNNTQLNGLTFNETFVYVALGSTIFILLKTYADWLISNEIRDGSITIFLAKPMDYPLYALAMSTGFMLTNLIAIGLPTVLMLTLVFKVSIPFGPGLLLFPFSLLMAFLISYCFDCITGLLTFYTESIWGISTTKEVIITVFSGALIPIQFFPEIMQRVLLFLPFQAIYHTPLMLFTRPNQDWSTLLSLIGIQFFWVVLLFICTRLVYNQAIKVLRVAGG